MKRGGALHRCQDRRARSGLRCAVAVERDERAGQHDAPSAMLDATGALRARLHIRHLSKQAAFVAARIVDDARRRDRRPSSRGASDRRPATPAGPACSGLPVRAKAIHASLIWSASRQRVGAGADHVRRDRGVVEDERHVEAVMRAPLAAVDRRPPVELEHPGAAPRPAAARRADRPRSPGRATSARRWSRRRTRRPANSPDASWR